MRDALADDIRILLAAIDAMSGKLREANESIAIDYAWDIGKTDDVLAWARDEVDNREALDAYRRLKALVA